jgi:hypothetical protein
MNSPSREFAYHGSPHPLQKAVPKRHVRSREQNDGTRTITFDDRSFHATPYYWIALAYTCNRKSYLLNHATVTYNMGVDLYDSSEKISIYGFESLEKSLTALYGDGGYIHLFDQKDFFYTPGLGDRECITTQTLAPIRTERIDDPVRILQSLGITFAWYDLADSHFAKMRNIVPNN